MPPFFVSQEPNRHLVRWMTALTNFLAMGLSVLKISKVGVVECGLCACQSGRGVVVVVDFGPGVLGRRGCGFFGRGDGGAGE